MSSLFQVLDYSTDTNLITLKIFSEKGDLFRNFHSRQFVVADDMNELELINALSQLAQMELEAAYPPPVPNPPALLAMVGKSYG